MKKKLVLQSHENVLPQIYIPWLLACVNFTPVTHCNLWCINDTKLDMLKNVGKCVRKLEIYGDTHDTAHMKACFQDVPDVPGSKTYVERSLS